MAGLDARGRLALVERRCLVPAPGDLGGEQRSSRDDEDGPSAAGRFDQPEGDEAREEGQDEDEVA